jgi:hypothetical protein
MPSDSVFSGHLLPAKNHAAVPRPGIRESWPSFFLAFCLVLLLMLRLRSFQKVLRIVQSTFSSQALQQLEREEGASLRFYSVALNCFFILNVSFLIYKINTYWPFILEEEPRIVQFLFIAGICILIFFFKTIVNRLLSLFTGERRIISAYSLNSTIVNQTFGLLLFPCVVLLEFSGIDHSVFIFAGLAVLAGALALKWYRGLMMGLVEERVGLLQIFSYFCGLEILPVFVLVKYIIQTF